MNMHLHTMEILDRPWSHLSQARSSKNTHLHTMENLGPLGRDYKVRTSINMHYTHCGNSWQAMELSGPGKNTYLHTMENLDRPWTGKILHEHTFTHHGEPSMTLQTMHAWITSMSTHLSSCIWCHSPCFGLPCRSDICMGEVLTCTETPTLKKVIFTKLECWWYMNKVSLCIILWHIWTAVMKWE